MHAKQMSLNITYRRVVNHFCQKSWPRPTPRREAPASACFAKTQEHAEA